MRDAITDLFLRIDDGPSEAFVDELRRRALAELTNGGTGATVQITADRPDAPSDTIDVVVRPISDAPGGRGRRRRRIIVLVAAAVAAAAIIVPVLRTDSRPEIDVIDDLTTTTDISAPTVPPTVEQTSTVAAAPVTGFSRQFSGDVTTADGQSFHVVADVSLPTPISTETELLNRDDLLLTPKVSITVTADDPTVTVTDAYAQIYFDSDFTDCVLNAGSVACDPFLHSQHADTPNPTAVGTGLTFPATGAPSIVGKVRLDAGSVDNALSKLNRGELVHGVAIVVDASPSDQPGTQIATVGFGASGEQVLSCASLPADCPEGTVGLTGGTTLSSGDTIAEPLPQGQFSAGTFDVPEQAVAFSITTAGTWFVDTLFENEVVLTRGVVGASQLIVVDSYASGGGINTAAEAIANICPAGTIDFGPVVQTTLLGLPAVQVEGPVLQACPRLGTLHGAIGDVNVQLQIGSDYTVRIRATDIDGTVVVMLGISPTSEWPAFSAELDATTLQPSS